MDEVITCKCGNQSWVIGTSGTRCSKCQKWLDEKDIEADIRKINDKLKTTEGE